METVVSLQDLPLRMITNTEGALLRLRERFNQPGYSMDSIHQLVKHGKLRALVYVDGILVEKTEELQSTRGKDLFFLYSDLEKLPQPQRGKPKKELINEA
jgi:hypothetical protein